MDILLEWQRHEFSLNGEKIAMELHPMQVGAVFHLMQIKPDSPDQKQIDIMVSIFNQYVRNIENLTVNGQPITPEQIATTAQLIPLSGQIMTKLTEISRLPEAEEKN